MTERWAVLNTSTETFIKKGQFAGRLYERKARAERAAASESHFEAVKVEV